MDWDNKGNPVNGKVSMFKEVQNIIGEKESYAIKFTKRKLEELYQKRNPNPAGPEQVQKYSVMEENGITIAIHNYEDFRV
jgi:hypothetical protein